MNDRQIGLIQRAAAKLKQADAPGVVPPVQVNFGPMSYATKDNPATTSKPAKNRNVSAPELIVDRGKLAKAGISFSADERSRLAEEFRVIKRQVLSIAQRPDAVDAAGKSKRLILVTSARPLEGKTFVAANLALAIASERDSRVLALDCDPARQTFSEAFGVGRRSGFGDLLAGDLDSVSEILIHTNIPNFNIIPFGQRHADTTELFSSKRMKGLMEEMGRRYPDRYIVIDAPPCLATSEASTLAPLVGQIMFVVEANRTQQTEIEEALRLVSACPNISLVLNKTDWDSPEQFGSHGYY